MPDGTRHVAMASYADLTFDRRVGAGPSGLPGVAAPIGRLLDRVGWIRRYRRTSATWGRWAIRRAGRVDAWHLHDLPALTAVAPRIPAGTPWVGDRHEVFLFVLLDTIRVLGWGFQSGVPNTLAFEPRYGRSVADA